MPVIFGGERRQSMWLLSDEIRETLVRARIDSGMTRDAFAARKMGVRTEHMRRLEAGLAMPSRDVMRRWANQLGFDIELVLKRKES